MARYGFPKMSSNPSPDTSQTEPSPEIVGDERRHCRSCRGAPGPPPAPPILHDALVIAARARAREPELPAETVSHALNGSMPRETARYDLILLPGEQGPSETSDMIGIEFARRGHRVFCLRSTDDSGSLRPGPPTFHRIALEAAAFTSNDALTDALRQLRLDHDIDAAVILLAGDRWRSVAEQFHLFAGWRFLTNATSADSADSRLGRVVAHATGDDTPPVSIDLDSLPSWPARWAAIDQAARSLFPRVSIVVITFDNLAYNRMCLASLLGYCEYPNLEIVVVDNGSTDGTVEFLQETTRRYPGVRIVLNEINNGFGPANNQGVLASSGEFVVLLNNDTLVARGCISRLAHHLNDPSIGLVGPATNRTCNEAQIDLVYTTYGEYARVARDAARRHDGERRPIRMLAMFCAAFRKSLFTDIGPLDERYAVGMFEDEDYAIRVRNLGYDIVWAPDVYVHHAYHASIGKLLTSGDYLRVFRTNQQAFEYKWGICWERHRPPVLAP